MLGYFSSIKKYAKATDAPSVLERYIILCCNSFLKFKINTRLISLRVELFLNHLIKYRWILNNVLANNKLLIQKIKKNYWWWCKRYKQLGTSTKPHSSRQLDLVEKSRGRWVIVTLRIILPLYGVIRMWILTSIFDEF